MTCGVTTSALRCSANLRTSILPPTRWFESRWLGCDACCKITTCTTLVQRRWKSACRRVLTCRTTRSEIRHQLARFHDLLVLNPSTAHTLDATRSSHFVVDGRMSVENGELRISLSLLDTVAARVIWTGNFNADHDTQELAALVVQAAEELVARMASTYGPISRQLVRQAHTRPG